MAGRVEFLDEPAAAPQPPPPPHRRRGRVRLPAVLVLVGVLLVGLLVGRAVTSDGDHDASPAPSPTQRPAVPLAQCRATGTAPAATSTVDRDGGTPVTVQVPDASDRTVDCSAQAARCPSANDGQNACASTSDVPRAVLLAVWSRFPSARLVSAREETIRENGALWFRYVRFHVALPVPAELSVEVSMGHPDDQSAGEWDDGSGTFSRAGVRAHNAAVVVSLAAPSGSPSSLDKQYALARDATLLTA